MNPLLKKVQSRVNYEKNSREPRESPSTGGIPQARDSFREALISKSKILTTDNFRILYDYF